MKRIFIILTMLVFVFAGCKITTSNLQVREPTPEDIELANATKDLDEELEEAESTEIGIGLINVTEVDGSPSAWVKKIKFTNTTVAVDGSDATVTIAGVSPGSGTMTTVELNDVGVGDADIVTLDFDSADFLPSEAPDTEVNIKLGVSPTIETSILPDAGDGAVIGSAAAEWSDLYLADSSVIYLGNDQDVTATHDPDDGIFLKSTATTDDNPFVLTIQTGETDMQAADVLGGIYFQAPDEGTGTDAILVAGGIEVISEGDFSATSNASQMDFKLGVSETASQKATLQSDGDFLIDGNLYPSAGDDFVGVTADDTFDFTRNDAGVVTITASDNNAVAALTVLAGGAADMTVGGSSGTDIILISDAVNINDADLVKIDGITNGTQAANKAVVADANVNTGISKVTELHIGTSGSETQVTATAAELNYNDITTLGTSQNSKALTLAANGNFTSSSGTWDMTNVTGITLSANEIVDADVVDTITASNYLPLAGGTMTGELVADNLGVEFTAGDDHSDCSAFAATGGGIFFDDSEGIFKKCQDNVLTDLDTDTGAATLYDDIGNPDAAGSISFDAGETATYTSAGTAGDQFNFIMTGAFGDISTMLLHQDGGNATNGTMLEVRTEDADVDHLLLAFDETPGGALEDYVIHKIADAGTYTIDVTSNGTAAVDIVDGLTAGSITSDGAITGGSATVDSGPVTLIQGAQTGDPQVVLDLTADANGDFSVTTDTGDILLVSAADITLTGANLLLSDGVVIQTATDNDAITLAANGEMTLTQELQAGAGIDATGQTIIASTFTGTASQVTVSDDEATNDEHEVVFTTNNTALESDGDMTYNPSTGVLTVPDLDLLGAPFPDDPGADRVLMWDDSETGAELIWTAAGAGDLLADGSVPLTANWDVGSFKITAQDLTADTGDVTVGDDIILADGAVVGIPANEIITFNAAGTIAISGADLAIGSNPADAGTGIRMSNNSVIEFEDTEGTGEVTALQVDSSEAILIGDANASAVTITPPTTVSGLITASVGITTTDVGVTLSDGAVLDQSANNLVEITENSDSVQFGFGGTDLDIVWSDGALNLRNNEDGVNAIVEIEGKDANERGELRVLSDGDDKYAALYHDDTNSIVASSSGNIVLSADADTNDYIMVDTTTNVPSISPDANDGGTLGTSAIGWSDAYLADGGVINFGDEAVMTHVADTEITFLTDIAVLDDKVIEFGTNDDTTLGYDETTDDRLELTTTLSAATGDEEAFAIVYTTNKATSGNDTGLLVNQTDTASPGTSYLMDLQVGGTSKFNIDNTGKMTQAAVNDPYLFLDAADAQDADWYITTDTDQDAAADDPLKFSLTGQNDATPEFEFQTDGDFIAEGTVKGTSLILEGGTYDTTIDPGTPTESVSYQWPLADGTDGQVLSTNASGVLSWSSVTAAADTTGGAGAIQYNSGGSLLSDADLVFDGNTLIIDQTASNDALAVTTGGTVPTWGNTPLVGIETVLEVDGITYLDGGLVVNEDVDINLDAADEEIAIDQTAVAGTEDVGLIKINDDRTGATATEQSEATIWIDAEGVYGISIVDGSLSVEGDIVPAATDGASLGTDTLDFSDVFLATGGVINFDSGSVTLTESSNNLVVAATTTTINSTLDVNEDVDIDFDASDEEVVISNSVTYGANGVQVLIENTAADITGAMYLLQLDYADNNDTDADFINCRYDTSGTPTSAFKVNSDGSVISAGSFTSAVTGQAGGFLPSAANGNALGSADQEFADLYLYDSGGILFGDDQDIRLIHDPDAGVILQAGDGTGDVDLKITFNSNTSDGVIQWMEDESEFRFDNPIIAPGKWGPDITTPTNHDTVETHGLYYMFTAAATVTLDAAADAGYGATVCYMVRDAAEAAVIDVQAGEKHNLDGTAGGAGIGITATGAGEKTCMVATTDSDGSGTDGWIVWGNTSGWASQ